MSPALELRGQVFLEWGSVDGLERGGCQMEVGWDGE